MIANLGDVSRDLHSMVKRASEGEEIIILVDGHPMAKLVAAQNQDDLKTDREAWVSELEAGADAVVCGKAVTTQQSYWDDSRSDRF